MTANEIPPPGEHPKDTRRPHADQVAYALERVQRFLVWIEEHRSSFEHARYTDLPTANRELRHLQDSTEQAVLHLQRLAELMIAGYRLESLNQNVCHRSWMRLVEALRAIRAVRTFTPAGNETTDVGALYDLLEQLGDLRQHPDIRRELISIFERFPDDDLGSLGPIVHALEESPIDEHVDLLAASLQRQATTMTVWMAERCLKAKLSDHSRLLLLESLAKAREQSNSTQVAEAIENALRVVG